MFEYWLSYLYRIERRHDPVSRIDKNAGKKTNYVKEF